MFLSLSPKTWDYKSIIYHSKLSFLPLSCPTSLPPSLPSYPPSLLSFIRYACWQLKSDLQTFKENTLLTEHSPSSLSLPSWVPWNEMPIVKSQLVCFYMLWLIDSYSSLYSSFTHARKLSWTVPSLRSVPHLFLSLCEEAKYLCSIMTFFSVSSCISHVCFGKSHVLVSPCFWL